MLYCTVLYCTLWCNYTNTYTETDDTNTHTNLPVAGKHPKHHCARVRHTCTALSCKLCRY